MVSSAQMSPGIGSLLHNSANNATYTSSICDSTILSVVRKQKTQKIWSLFYKFKKVGLPSTFQKKKQRSGTREKKPNNFVGNKADFVEVIHMNTENIIRAPVMGSGRLKVPRKTSERNEWPSVFLEILSFPQAREQTCRIYQK